MVRMSAEERRESVIRAATTEFARGGYHGTSTEAIAKRVGVSQPYLFRLFPGKKAIFLAAASRCVEETMANAYTKVIAERPELLLMQMQMYVAVGAAEEEGDHAFGEAVRDGWMRLWDTVHLPLGADANETTVFLAFGMLINCLVAMGFPPEHRVWEGMYPSARLKGRLEH
jgi:AcrR family transcriptional regulator